MRARGSHVGPRIGITGGALLSAAFWLTAAEAQQQPPTQQPPAQAQQAQPQQPASQPSAIMQETVVTATGRPEPVTNVVGTVQVIDGEKISKSTAKSVTELLQQNAVGFLSQWSAGQTSINIRGGASDGQGRDYKSEVLVLINSHRAGTANLSKLSIADVERIEIVRGPSSVVYGSQNMGGVINIILKTGRTAPGNIVEGDMGTWALVEGKGQTAGVYKDYDWYVGLHGGTQGNYQVGGGEYEANTAWNRAGGSGSFGWKIDDNNRLDMTVRSDGVYDTGFRGSSANIFAFDTRYNRSIDFSYNGKTSDDRAHLYFQGYYVQDVDDLNNPSPLSALNAVASRTLTDHNRRQLDIQGFRLQPRYKPWSGNELLVGVDWEQTWISSTRNRAGGAKVTQLSPQDNNEFDNVWALYAEESQKLLDDRLILRGGVRQTFGTTTLLATPYAYTLVPGSVNYQATTYMAGATMQFKPWLVGRMGASSGFRAPTATELGANYTTTPIGTTIFGNPNISPETSQQLEVGATIDTSSLWLDMALFQNVIGNRIQAVTISSAGGVTVQQYQNNPGNILLQGLEVQTEIDMLGLLNVGSRSSERWSVFGNGYYNFTMTDYGAAQMHLTSSQATRVNQYALTIGTRYSKTEAEWPWSFQLFGVWNGPMWYNTEESLSPIYYPGQVRNVTVYQKGAYWVWNTRYDIEIRKGVGLFLAVNNILDVNQSPVFIATDQGTCRANWANQNGSCGNSMPGRQLIVGAQVTF